SFVAAGIRGAQRLAVYPFDGEPWLTFVDPGGWVSEELNAVRVSDLLRNGSLTNFGWGLNPFDRRAREGTFYLDGVGNASAKIAVAEPAFVDPVAELGRLGVEPFAITGPVASSRSFRRISFLFGDLVSGELFATIGPPTMTRQQVQRVNLIR